jgi:hypothetical protein
MTSYAAQVRAAASATVASAIRGGISSFGSTTSVTVKTSDPNTTSRIVAQRPDGTRDSGV